jgi:hypothetical protein
MDEVYGRMEALPTAPDLGRRLWAQFAKIEADHRRFESRPVIGADDITNLRIVLGTAKTVQDVIDNG